MTILFYEDWEKYGAFPDYSTTNESAIRVATSFKRMGVANHSFVLALYDKDLVGVDPFDPNLTMEMQGKITVEFSRNIWYAIRECIRIPPVVGIDGIPFKFHRANVALIWLYLTRVFNLNVISRQRGKTTAVVALFICLLNTRSNLTISGITKDDSLRASTIRTFKKVYELLPEFLQFRGSGDSRNTTDFTVNGLGSVFKQLVSSQNPKQAYKAGRGLVTSTAWGDEVCYIPHISIALGACIATGTHAREEAEEKGEFNGIILTTTAGNIDDRDAGYIYDMSQNSTIFNEMLYDATNRDELHSIIRNNNPKALVRTYCVFNHRQLGVSDAQQREAILMSAQSKTDAERDFLSIWNRGNGGHVLPQHILNVINGSIQDPVYCHISKPENNMVNWYLDKDTIEELVNHPMVLAIDPSEGIGIDANALVLTSAVTGELLASAEQSIASVPAYTRWVYKYFVSRFPYMVIIIENRSTGQALIDGLAELMIADGINPFQRLFNTIVQESEVFKDQFEQIKPINYRPSDNRHIMYKKYFGFKTSGGGTYARSALYGELFFSVCQTYGRTFKDRRLIGQIANLIEKDGKITHPAGGHDDSVVALLLAHWFLHNAKHMEFYGISSQYVLSVNTDDTEYNTVEAKERELKSKYRDMLNELQATENPYVRKRLIHQLRNLELESPFVLDGATSTMRQVVEDFKTKKSVDQTIEISENRSPKNVIFRNSYIWPR